MERLSDDTSPRYLVEVYVPQVSAGELPRAAARARAAAEEVSRAGNQVRYLRSLFVPGDELCLLLFAASSAEAVGEATRRAAISSERIVEAREIAVREAAEGRDGR